MGCSEERPSQATGYGTGFSGARHGPPATDVLPAFARDAGMVIGQRCVDGKSNEVTALPLLLETLALEKTIVAIDAMGTQKIIAQAIPGKKKRLSFGSR